MIILQRLYFFHGVKALHDSNDAELLEQFLFSVEIGLERKALDCDRFSCSASKADQAVGRSLLRCFYVVVAKLQIGCVNTTKSAVLFATM